jgi:protein-S-isoprenylcysteine O-methyltransferase Ste14
MITGWFVAACWAVFAAYWLASATRVKAVSVSTGLGFNLRHRVLLFATYVLLLDRWLPWPFDMRLVPNLIAIRVAGDVICVVGLAVAISARRALAGNWSSAVTLKQDHELIRTGPYRLVRHPIYTGILTICLGSAIEDGQLRGAIAFATMLIAFWIKARREEQLLMQHFPDAYPAYRRETKALVPFVV